MKKFAVLLLTVIMVFSLAACGAVTPAARKPRRKNWRPRAIPCSEKGEQT